MYTIASLPQIQYIPVYPMMFGIYLPTYHSISSHHYMPVHIVGSGCSCSHHHYPHAAPAATPHHYTPGHVVGSCCSCSHCDCSTNQLHLHPHAGHSHPHASHSGHFVGSFGGTSNDQTLQQLATTAGSFQQFSRSCLSTVSAMIASLSNPSAVSQLNSGVSAILSAASDSVLPEQAKFQYNAASFFSTVDPTKLLNLKKATFAVLYATPGDNLLRAYGQFLVSLSQTMDLQSSSDYTTLATIAQHNMTLAGEQLTKGFNSLLITFSTTATPAVFSSGTIATLKNYAAQLPSVTGVALSKLLAEIQYTLNNVTFCTAGGPPAGLTNTLRPLTSNFPPNVNTASANVSCCCQEHVGSFGTNSDEDSLLIKLAGFASVSPFIDSGCRSKINALIQQLSSPALKKTLTTLFNEISPNKSPEAQIPSILKFQALCAQSVSTIPASTVQALNKFVDKATSHTGDARVQAFCGFLYTMFDGLSLIPSSYVQIAATFYQNSQTYTGANLIRAGIGLFTQLYAHSTVPFYLPTTLNELQYVFFLIQDAKEHELPEFLAQFQGYASKLNICSPSSPLESIGGQLLR